MSYAFNEARHIHTWDGKPLHGVTSILKSWGDPGSLINWAANQAVDAIERGEAPADARKAHLKVRDKAGDKGKEVHALLEDAMNQWIDRGARPLMGDEVVDKVTEWMESAGYKPLRSEYPVYHLELWYAGIMDAVVEQNGKKFILDFKTSGSVQTKYFYQCGAYSLAIKDMKSEADIAGAIIVHIPRGTSFDPEKNLIIRYDMQALEQAFASILNVYKLDLELNKTLKW